MILISHLSAVSRNTSKTEKVMALICIQAGLDVELFAGINNKVDKRSLNSRNRVSLSTVVVNDLF